MPEGKHGRPWTNRDVERLRLGCAKLESTYKMAYDLGRTEASVKKKKSELGLYTPQVKGRGVEVYLKQPIASRYYPRSYVKTKKAKKAATRTAFPALWNEEPIAPPQNHAPRFVGDDGEEE
jgi:hypothetical protein